jgi:hypothetical protein
MSEINNLSIARIFFESKEEIILYLYGSPNPCVTAHYSQS